MGKFNKPFAGALAHITTSRLICQELFQFFVDFLYQPCYIGFGAGTVVLHLKKMVPFAESLTHTPKHTLLTVAIGT